MRSSLPALAAAVAVLAGCDTTLPWSSGDRPSSPGGSIAVAPSSLAFSAREGGPAPASKSAVLTVQGSVYVGVEHSGAAVAAATLVQTSATTADVVVTPVAPSQAGNPSGTVTVLGCTDPQCTSQVAGSPAVISVSYAIAAQTLAVDPASLAFDHLQGAAVPAGQSLAVSDSAGGGYTAAVAYTGASGWLALDRTSGTSLPDAIGVTVNPSGRAIGTYAATVTVTSAGGARAVPVTMTVRRPAIEVAPASLAFDAVTGQAPVPAAKTLGLSTEADVPVAFTAAVTYGPGASGWLTGAASGSAPATLSVRPGTTALAAGSYDATVRITPGNSAPAVDVPVSYVVSAPSLAVSPASAAFAVTAATTPAEAMRTLGVSDAGTTLVYAAASTAPWLSVTPAAGSTGADPELTLALVAAELPKLANGAHTAEVVLTYAEPSAATVEVRVPVTLDLALPRVTFVAPRVAVAGTSAEVILRGAGLGGAAGLQFGASSATAFTVASATEIRATHPELTAGAYLVSVPTALGIDLGATLVVVDPVTRAAAAIASAGAKTSVVFDDARAAIYVAASGTVERYREANAWARETLALASLRDLALSPDGTRLVAVAGASIWEIDPDAFVLPAQAAATLTGYDAASYWRLAFANDGTGVLAATLTDLGGLGFVNCRKYDFRTKTASSLAGCSYYSGGLGASGDGRRVVVAGSGVSPPQRVGHYDASAGAFQVSAVGTGYDRAALDRTGTRVILQLYGVAPSVRDAAYAELGKLSTTTWVALSSADGTQAYAWDNSGKVRVFDLAAAPVAGVYPELGTAGGTVPVATPGAGVRLALSADGRTLVLAGDQRVVFFPLP